MRIDTGELYFADCRQDVIINQTEISICVAMSLHNLFLR